MDNSSKEAKQNFIEERNEKYIMIAIVFIILCYCGFFNKIF